MTKIKVNINLIQELIKFKMAQLYIKTTIQIQTYHKMNQLWMAHLIDMIIHPKLVELKITVPIIIN